MTWQIWGGGSRKSRKSVVCTLFLMRCYSLFQWNHWFDEYTLRTLSQGQSKKSSYFTILCAHWSCFMLQVFGSLPRRKETCGLLTIWVAYSWFEIKNAIPTSLIRTDSIGLPEAVASVSWRRNSVRDLPDVTKKAYAMRLPAWPCCTGTFYHIGHHNRWDLTWHRAQIIFQIMVESPRKLRRGLTS